MNHRKRVPVLFLWHQAVLVAGWWTMLGLAPASRKYFLFADWPEATLFAFVLPDGILLVCGSVLAAIGLQRQRAWALRTFAIVLGGALYAMLYCLAASLFAGGGELATPLMALCVAANAYCFGLARDLR